MNLRPEKFISLNGGSGRAERFAVNISLHNKRFAPKIPAVIRDLSADGAFLETLPELLGRLIDLEFSFPGQQKPFHVTGKIVWNRYNHPANRDNPKPVGMGVQFVRYLRGSREEIDKSIRAWNELWRSPQSTQHLQVIQAEATAITTEIPEATLVQIPCALNDVEIESFLESFLEQLEAR